MSVRYSGKIVGFKISFIHMDLSAVDYRIWRFPLYATEYEYFLEHLDFSIVIK